MAALVTIVTDNFCAAAGGTSGNRALDVAASVVVSSGTSGSGQQSYCVNVVVLVVGCLSNGVDLDELHECFELLVVIGAGSPSLPQWFPGGRQSLQESRTQNVILHHNA